MARISGVDLPRDKKVEIGLTYIFGIGRVLARRILANTGVNPEQRIRDLSDADVNKLRQEIEKQYRVEGGVAHRGRDEREAPDGHRVVSWDAASPWPPGPWAAHAHQRPHEEGAAPRDRGEEEGD